MIGFAQAAPWEADHFGDRILFRKLEKQLGEDRINEQDAEAGKVIHKVNL
jgi:hypothetical protein